MVWSELEKKDGLSIYGRQADWKEQANKSKTYMEQVSSINIKQRTENEKRIQRNYKRPENVDLFQIMKRIAA